MTEPVLRISTAQPVLRVDTPSPIIRVSGGFRGPKGDKGDQGDPGQLGTQKVLAWNMTNPDDRALWTPSGIARRTYGTFSEGSRDLLGCDVDPYQTPVQTVFTESFTVFVSWSGPLIDVEEGDILDFTCVGRWERNESTLSTPVVDTDLGNPNYSAAYDKNGFGLRAYFNPRMGYASGFYFLNGGNPEPQSRGFSRWWRDLTWSSVEQSVVATEACQVLPTINFGPIWAHVGGLLVIDSVGLVISSRTAPGLGGEVVGFKHDQASPATVWTINHNQGKFPLSVQQYSVGGVLMMGATMNLNVNQTQITFNTAVAGTAALIF